MKYIKPNTYPIKGSYNRIGYGCISKKRVKFHKLGKRKAYRECRKFGFDLSEVWNLDCTILGWLSDNIGGYFRECGDPFTWDEVDLEGNSYKNNTEACMKAWFIRRNKFRYNLNNFLKNTDKETFKKFTQFVVPRLTILINNVHGYPGTMNSCEEWKETLDNMKCSFLLGGYSKDFIKYFFSLWD